MKKLINDPRAVVREMLEGAVALAPEQALLQDESVVVRRSIPTPRPVAVLTGGGSGHEPAHAGYVGRGMLSAAIAGEIFTSPSTDAVLAGIRAVAGPAGALLIVKNYMGDRLNFGLAAEMARAEGIPVEIVVVADDVALRNTVERDRRRGIAGTILMHKIAGAAAEAGLPLAEVARVAREAIANLGTMGVSFGPCTLPAAGKPGFTLGDNEIELGLGIHGEPGVERITLRPADELAKVMIDTIVEELKLTAGERVAVLANGLGSTPPIELHILARAALSHLRALNIPVARAWAGTFMSALDMPGCSISLLRVDDERLALLDAACEAPAWPGPGKLNTEIRVTGAARAQAESAEPATKLSNADLRIRDAALAVADALDAAESLLTELDGKTGDGDLGSSMARGAAAIRALPDSAWRSPRVALASLSDALRRAIAGSSGPLYATALLRASRRIGDGTPSVNDWVDAFSEAVEAVAELGGAKPGDRTMLDALHPAAQAMTALASQAAPPAGIWRAGLEAARAGAQKTASMTPRLGRATYYGAKAVGIPDGGAIAVTVWLAALAKAFGGVSD
jgi:ATP-dependent dihydroxyacetone kinase